jgi:NAD(P)H-dependent FMN reductase
MKKIAVLLLYICTVMFSQTCADSTNAQKTAIKFLVISCSLSPTSHSALLAEQAVKNFKAEGQDVDFIDLRQYNLPLSNGHEGSAYDNPQVKEIHDRIDKADGVIIASPIYNNSVAAVTKNLFELTSHPHKTILSGKAWNGKVVGFMGASGGKASTYAFFPFLNSVTIESKIVSVPTFVMVSGDDFDDKNQFNPETGKRIDTVVKDLIRMTAALKS